MSLKENSIDNLRRRNLHKQNESEFKESEKSVSKEKSEKISSKEEKNLLDNFNNLLNSLKPHKTSYHLTRIVIIRFVAFIYAVAFLVAFNQNKELLGKNGLLPANKYMEKLEKYFKLKKFYENEFLNDLRNKLEFFIQVPTLYWFFNWSENIDLLLTSTSLIGLSISIFIIINGAANSILMTTLWLLYHSIVNIGQTWYSFGWESQLLESGFISIFLVPFLSLKKINEKSPPSFVAIVLYRWLIFRIMIGAGLIKIRGDKCWLDLTCMNYFYETQPVPNPFSFYLHKEPEFMHKFEVLSNHFIELIAPFFILLPFRPMRLIGGSIQIIFQVVLIMSGNLSFLNWLTILPSLACFDDHFYMVLFKLNRNSSLWKLLKIQYLEKIKTPNLSKGFLIKKRIRTAIDLLLLSLVAYLSWPVVMNLVSKKQAMNTSFEPFRLVNTYGAFGSVTKERYEVIFKGSHSEKIKEEKSDSHWLEYEFKCKPGNINRRPCIISPYHYRLDWLMWFAAFQSYEYNPWLLSLSAKFLLNDKNFTSQMIALNPFENIKPPNYIRADLYLYKYSDSNSTTWWRRKFVRNYIPAITLKHLEPYLKELAWDL